MALLLSKVLRNATWHLYLAKVLSNGTWHLYLAKYFAMLLGTATNFPAHDGLETFFAWIRARYDENLHSDIMSAMSDSILIIESISEVCGVNFAVPFRPIETDQDEPVGGPSFSLIASNPIASAQPL